MTKLKLVKNANGTGEITLQPAQSEGTSTVTLPSSGTIATTSQIPDVSNLADKASVNSKIALSGNRGQLAGFESTVAGTVINETSPDTQFSNGAITVQDGTSGKSWTKVMMINNAGHTITLGGAWKWVGGSQPELKVPCVLTCHWNNSVGIANLICGA